MEKGGLGFCLVQGLAMCIVETAFLEEVASLKGCLSHQSLSQAPALQQEEQTTTAYAAEAFINSGDAEDRGCTKDKGIQVQCSPQHYT